MTRKWVVVLRGILADEGAESLLRGKFDPLLESAEVFRVPRLENIETPEAMLLGLHPSEGQMAPGPLTVASLGADPPERSTHFDVALLSMNDNEIVGRYQDRLTTEENREVKRVGERLNTRKLTFLFDGGGAQGLVWEDLGGLGCTPPTDAVGKLLSKVRPKGDGDRMLERWIDDSVNMLFELDFNRRRADEGKPPINVLWPWGPGTRFRVPQLPIRRGFPALIQSPSVRLAGLTRLAGYRHEWIDSEPAFEASYASSKKWDRGVSVFDFPYRGPEDAEHSDWLLHAFTTRWLPQFLAEAEKGDTLGILALGSRAGLGLQWENGTLSTSTAPFDERVLEERRLPERDLHSFLEVMLS